MHQGVINQIIGPVIDIKFEEGELPELLNAIKIPHNDDTVMGRWHSTSGMMSFAVWRFLRRTG